MAKSKKSDAQIKRDRTSQIMHVIDERAGYYRENPHRFADEFLNVKLKLFQKILLWGMMHVDAFQFVAARGLGKTWLLALFCVIRCILWPGSKVVVASYTFKQGKEIALKITDDFMKRSSLLRNEIQKVTISLNDCVIYFKNGSWIRVVTASESSRGARSNILVIDESRMVDKKIIDTVLRPMNASPRQPGYLSKPEYAHLQEMNKEMYLSSAWFAASPMLDQVKAYTANFLDPSLNYFICDLPYQLSIKEGLLMREQIQNMFMEATFSDISFMMEYRGMFYGSAEDALYDFDTLNKRRVIVNSLHCLDYYRDGQHRIPDKQDGEVRVLSVDVALLASRKHDNDAAALILHQGMPTANHMYLDNVVFIDTFEGLRTEELGLEVMRWFYQYNCDYIGLDANGLGIGVLDYIMADQYDPIYGQQYGALDVIDNPTLSERCKIKGAPKCIFAINGNSRLNNDIALELRSGFQNGYINLLISDNNVEEKLSKIRGYSKLSDNMQTKLQLPYVQTTFLIDELINLGHDTSNGLVRVKEKRGMRKDRYSSLGYGYHVLQMLGRKLKPKNDNISNLIDKMKIRPARKVGSF